MAQETVGHLCLKELAAHLDYLGHDDSISVSFPHQVTTSLELVQSPFLTLLLSAQVVENELEVLARCPEHDLVLTAVEFVVMDLDQIVVDEDVAVDYVEHAS